MKRFITSVLALVAISFSLTAQNVQEVESEERDVAVDSTLFGLSVKEAMPACVHINQSRKVEETLHSQILSNASRQFNGYRVRIYFGSSQNARQQSVQAMNKFREWYPDVSVYRSFSSPNFKVTAGNFRTRLEAEEFLMRIKDDFPDASVVREKFKYPSLERAKSVRDTTFIF